MEKISESPGRCSNSSVRVGHIGHFVKKFGHLKTTTRSNQISKSEIMSLEQILGDHTSL